jgi:hypothetical protein
LILKPDGFSAESDGSFRHGGEIDVRGDVGLTRSGERVFTGAVMGKRADRSRRPVRMVVAERART